MTFGQWVRELILIFVRTPQRFLATLVGLGVLYLYLNPAEISRMVVQLQLFLHELESRVLAPAMALVIAVVALALLVKLFTSVAFGKKVGGK